MIQSTQGPEVGHSETPACNVTIVTSSNPSRLTKQFHLSDGELHKNSGGVLIQGNIEVREIRSYAEFGDLIESLKPNQALVYGTPKTANISKLTTEKRWLEAGRPDDTISRTKEQFAWPSGPGVMMLDYDPSPSETPMVQDELVTALRTAVPGLKDAAMLWYPSASSHITNSESGEDLTGLRGQRIYLLVKNASDIPRAGQALAEALWANGFGHIEISTSGSLLERTIVDTSVWQTNRFDFAAGASCIPPLMQKRGKPVIISGSTDLVDTLKAIPDPTIELKTKAATAKSSSKNAKSDEAGFIREQWTDQRIAEMVGSDADEDKKTAARETLKRALEFGTLGGDFIIKLVINGKFCETSVGEILDDPIKYHGAQTLDPIEPEYCDHKAVGKLYTIGARPNLHSFAHGGRTFKLLRQLSRVELVKGRTHDSVLETLEILRRAPDVFDFGGALVLVNDGHIYPLEDAGLVHCLGGITQFWRWHKMPNNTLVEVLEDPPVRVTKAILSLGAGRKLKPLEAVVTAPTLRPNGTVMDVPGYDPSTGLLLETEQTLVSVPSKPSKSEVMDALNTLLFPFRDFPLSGPSDWGVLLAALLTAVVRPALPTSPAFGFDAPVQASGKSLLASCIGALATGEVPTVWPHTSGRDDEEVRKRLFTALRNGTRALIWDNIIGQFDSAAMAAALTASNMTDRVLGKSESISIPNHAIVLMTGNNLTLAGDMPRRVLTCRIDPKTDRPFAREFDLDPLSYVSCHRQVLVSAALTIVRGWLTSQAPRAHGRMASFDLWDDYVRQAVAWVGRDVCSGKFSDPMDAVTEAQASDPEQEALLEMMVAWQALLGDVYITAAGALKASNDSFSDAAARLKEAFIDLNSGRDVSTAKALGRVLGFRLGRIVGGLHLQVKKDTSANVKMWRVINSEQEL